MLSPPQPPEFGNNTDGVGDNKNKKNKKAPILINGVAPQRLNSTSGPLQVHFLCSFLWNDPEVAQYHRVNLQTLGAFFLECAVDKCSMKCVRHIGNARLLNLWYRPVLEINPAYLIYPQPDLSMSRPK